MSDITQWDELEQVAEKAGKDKISFILAAQPAVILQLIAENKQLQEDNKKLKTRTCKAELERQMCYDAGLNFMQERDELAAKVREMEDAGPKYMPMAMNSHDEAGGRHPNDKTVGDDDCRKALDLRGDDRGQGLCVYWKWGFREGWAAHKLLKAKLDKPVRIGAVNFNVGVSVQMALDAGHRLWLHHQQPEVEAERIKTAQQNIKSIFSANRPTPDEIDRHTILAKDCPPNSQVMLVSSICRLQSAQSVDGMVEALLSGVTE